MKSLCLSLFFFLLSGIYSFSYSFPDHINSKAGLSSDSLPVIYVPGIMGSPLYYDINDDDKLEDLEKAWVGVQFGALLLDTNGIDPSEPDFNIKVAPIRNDTGNTLRDELNEEPLDLFKGFFDNLEANGYVMDDYDDVHNEGENLFCFPYDWRKNNVGNAELLSDFIDSVLNWTGASKVNLVGHSMGGIVSKTCIKLFDKSRIEKMVFIGTPHLGAPEVMTVQLTGKLFEWLNNIFTNTWIKAFGRNLLSCYQLIPTRSYFDLDLSNEVSTDVDVYSECFQLIDSSYLNYDEMIQYLRDYQSPFGEDLNDALIDSSEIFKEIVDTVDFGDVQVFNIVGHHYWTIGKNKETRDPILQWIVIEDERNINGDYTVPVRCAELINGRVFENTYYIKDSVHSGLPSSPSTLEILLGVFSDPPVTYFSQYSSPPSSYRDTVTIVSVNDDGKIINTFYLSQNYPNPFNPVTTLKYQIPAPGHVTLKLYDVLGSEIGTLVNEEKSAGIYELTFYAGNLPSGIYFYQLRTEKFVVTKKMNLVK